jgi:hypothetical protein
VWDATTCCLPSVSFQLVPDPRCVAVVCRGVVWPQAQADAGGRYTGKEAEVGQCLRELQNFLKEKDPQNVSPAQAMLRGTQVLGQRRLSRGSSAYQLQSPATAATRMFTSGSATAHMPTHQRHAQSLNHSITGVGRPHACAAG